jgi:hypothetical protein
LNTPLARISPSSSSNNAPFTTDPSKTIITYLKDIHTYLQSYT